METTSYPWIKREIADTIYQKILTKPAGLHIFVVEASAGIGKTYIARDIGTRLGSKNGYEHSHVGDLYWSGIIDLYDPDSSNSKHIEDHWMEAFSVAGVEFQEYHRERKSYEESKSTSGVRAELDKHIENIRKAFATGMKSVSEEIYPVIAFDTIERLQSAMDPTQQLLDIEAVESPNVLDWFMFQLHYLEHGVILMLGRSVPRLVRQLRKNIRTIINPVRRTNKLKPIILEVIQLSTLTEKEEEFLFEHRIASHPELCTLLDPQLKTLIVEKTSGNPLLVDITLQSLLETRDSEKISRALKSVHGLQAVEEHLLKSYMQSGSTEKQAILHYLAIARNGLFENLLQFLDPASFPRLNEELNRIEALPFIKVREISTILPGEQKRVRKQTYFLHDEMYTICDRVGLIHPEEISQDSKQVVRWYADRLQEHLENLGNNTKRFTEEIVDLLVESLPYRMRSDPKEGYLWYLEQAEQAIRQAERDLDLRLHEVMSQFLGRAQQKDLGGKQPLTSIDHEIIISKAPDLYLDFKLDSALQWVKRFSTRGRYKKALHIAEQATWVKKGYLSDPDRYRITYAELRLWQGQALGYLGNVHEANEVYDEIINELSSIHSPESISKAIDSHTMNVVNARKICRIMGRLYNNRGYIHWMYQGKYKKAIGEFLEADRYFELVSLSEESGNTKDNIGRVYTMLGVDFPAFDSIREGLELRSNAGLAYREALSRNSLAIAYARFDNVSQAIKEADNALTISRRIQIERGIGLAQITRGMALRKEAEAWKEMGLTLEQALEQIDRGEIDLREAYNIFSEYVDEPIRKIQACNELACCYRARYHLLEKQHTPKRENAFERGNEFFNLAIAEAEKYKFVIEKLDNLQDRAVLSFWARRFDEVNSDTNLITQLIPDDHLIKPLQGLPSLDINERVDAYYKILGQVELLKGAIIFEQGIENQNSSNDISKNLIVSDMMEHYVLAVAYFNAFSGAVTYRQTFSRIFARLRSCNREFLLELRDKKLGDWIEKYSLSSDTIRTEFDAIFGMLIPG